MSSLSPVLYDYLAEIYWLRDVAADSDSYLSTVELVDALLAAQSTVNRTLERLRQMRFIQHKAYHGVRLTAAGERAALVCLRKQRIIEAFLISVMGFDWHEIYTEAKRMRHHVTPPLLRQMWEKAGQPCTSPFGEFIPDAEGNVSQMTDMRLAGAPAEAQYRITRVMTRASDRLQYMAALQLLPGTQLMLLHQSPFEGPMQLQIQQEYRIIGYELARMLRVVQE